ncbi:acid phosphatase [Propionivibrio sp.]|uniref:acid phosphatase n=1 Tax=Propionivibrio sp. TaxID=2212460 RepID=UPI0039E432C8
MRSRFTPYLFTLCGLSLAACSTQTPPTSPDGLSGGRPGYVIGYLASSEQPDSATFLPPPPQAGSAAQAADDEAYRNTRALKGTPRWALAVRDADLSFPHAAQVFSCALGIRISEQDTPHLNMLIRRVRADASRSNDKAKDLYKRRRPYLTFGDASCTPAEKHKDDSYPSGHTSIGWAWALVLAELAPDRADRVFARGLAFGESRVICGVHWKSDIDAGRIVGAATVSRLHANPLFAAQFVLARQEVEKARAAATRPQADCAEEAKALAVR